MPIWQAHPDLMTRLEKAQNHPGQSHRDIMTFAGFCETREELERHVVANEAACARHDAQLAEAA